MKTIKKDIVQVRAGGATRNYTLWVVPPKRFSRMRKNGTLVQTAAVACCSWDHSFIDGEDEIISVVDILYDEKDEIKENEIYVIPSNELRKFNIGSINHLVDHIDGFWNMDREDINEHFNENTPVYRLFNTVSEAAKYKLTL